MPIPEKVSDSSSWAADGRWSELNVKHFLTFYFYILLMAAQTKKGPSNGQRTKVSTMMRSTSFSSVRQGKQKSTKARTAA